MTRKTIIIVMAGLVIAVGGYVLWQKQVSSLAQQADHSKNAANQATPVGVATARRGDIDVLIDALGTITARKTVTVKTLVDGQLIRVAFREGQSVKSGDLLDVIDPRPFQVTLDQFTGQLLRDQALLEDARLDLARYQGLLAKNSIPKQQVDTQLALLHQYQGTVLADQAQRDNARLQLSFTDVVAPVAGRLGLRLVDAGNIVHASDPGGLVVITQTQPIDVIFAIPADNLDQVLQHLRNGDSLPVAAYDRDDKIRLATGKLLTVDNQIDVTTGTVKLKATFDNADNLLFPNQFVNVHLRLATLHGAILIPVAAIQSGVDGRFVYVIKAADTVHVQPVTLGPQVGETVAITEGLKAGQQVVIDGVDKLREGSKISPVIPHTARSPAAKGDA